MDYAIDLLTICLSLLHECIYTSLVISSALPEYLHIFTAWATVSYPFLHSLVESTASKTATYNEEVFLLRVEPIELQGFRLHGLVSRNDLLADRVAGQYDSVRWEEPFHTLVCDTDALGLLAEYLVGQSCEAVLLLNQGRNPHAASSPKQGSACVSSDTDGNVRLELADNFLCHPHALDHLERECEV